MFTVMFSPNTNITTTITTPRITITTTKGSTDTGEAVGKTFLGSMQMYISCSLSWATTTNANTNSDVNQGEFIWITVVSVKCIFKMRDNKHSWKHTLWPAAYTDSYMRALVWEQTNLNINLKRKKNVAIRWGSLLSFSGSIPQPLPRSLWKKLSAATQFTESSGSADKRALSTCAKMEHHKLIYTEIELNCWIKNLNLLKMPRQRLCLFDQTKKLSKRPNWTWLCDFRLE